MAEGRDPKQYLRLKNRPKDLQIMANILKEMGVDDYEPGVLNHMLEFSHRNNLTTAEGRDPKQNLRLKNRPKDLQVMTNILKEMGVDDYEPGIPNHMLEFSYRYITTIVNEAYAYSRHASKQCIDAEDVKLAISIYHDRIASPPSRDVIDEIAKMKNSMPLPQIKSNAGLRLPSDRHSLTACNYRLKTPTKKPKYGMSGLKMGNMSGNKALSSSPSSPPKSVSSLIDPMDSPTVQYSDVHAVSSTVPDPPVMPEMIPVSAVTTMSQMLLPSFGVASASNPILMSPMGIISTSVSQMLSNSEDGVDSSTHIHMPLDASINDDSNHPGEATPLFKEDEKERNEDEEYEEYDLECSNEQFDME